VYTRQPVMYIKQQQILVGKNHSNGPKASGWEVVGELEAAERMLQH